MIFHSFVCRSVHFPTQWFGSVGFFHCLVSARARFRFGSCICVALLVGSGFDFLFCLSVGWFGFVFSLGGGVGLVGGAIFCDRPPV